MEDICHKLANEVGKQFQAFDKNEKRKKGYAFDKEKRNDITPT